MNGAGIMLYNTLVFVPARNSPLQHVVVQTDLDFSNLLRAMHDPCVRHPSFIGS